MTQSEKERRDRNFKKLCRWMHEAGEIAEILKEESSLINSTDKEECWENDINAKGIHSALAMLYFMSSLADFPCDYRDYDVADDNRNKYPELAYGMIFLALATGQMRENDGSPNAWGF